MAPVNYAICAAEESTGSAPSTLADNTPFTSSCNSHLAQPQDDDILNQRLKHYESYLGDYDQFRRKRLRWIAMKKYTSIMQSVKNKYKDRFQFEYHEEEDSDDDDEEDADLFDNSERKPVTSPFSGRGTMRSLNHHDPRKQDFPDLNRILRKNRARLSANQPTH